MKCSGSRNNSCHDVSSRWLFQCLQQERWYRGDVGRFAQEMSHSLPSRWYRGNPQEMPRSQIMACEIPLLHCLHTQTPLPFWHNDSFCTNNFHKLSDTLHCVIQQLRKWENRAIMPMQSGSSKKTSQELRMLSSVTINCHEFRFSIVRIVISVSNVPSLQDCLFNCQNGNSNCLNYENCRQLSSIVKIVKKVLKL